MTKKNDKYKLEKNEFHNYTINFLLFSNKNNNDYNFKISPKDETYKIKSTDKEKKKNNKICKKVFQNKILYIYNIFNIFNNIIFQLLLSIYIPLALKKK